MSEPESTLTGASVVAWLRQVSPYFQRHRGQTFVVYLGGEAIAGAGFPQIVQDLSLLCGIGVKLVENSVVRFVPVALVADDKDGVWVAGLPDEATVITVGQDYVKDGEVVNAVPEESVTAGDATTSAAN